MKNLRSVFFSLVPVSMLLTFVDGSSAMNQKYTSFDYIEDEEDVDEFDELLADAGLESSADGNRGGGTGTPSVSPENSYPGRNRVNEVYAGAPFPKNGIHMAAFGEFLYWTSGYDLHNAVLAGDPGSTVPAFRKLPSFESHYQPGFRVGLETQLAAQGWDILADWVCFHNNKSKTFHNHPGGNRGLAVAWTNSWQQVYPAQQSGNGFEKATTHLTYNQIDFTMGKEIYFSKYYSLRPSIGGRYVHIDNGFKLFYGNTDIPAAYDLMEMEDRIHAFGFTFGLDNKFLLGYGLSILGNMGGGLVYGSNNVDYLGTASQAAGDHFIGNGLQTKFRGHDLIPVIDTRIDLNWEHSFFKEKLGLDLYIGYEYHVLINGFTALTFPLAVNTLQIFDVLRTNLYMHGMNVGAKLSF